MRLNKHKNMKYKYYFRTWPAFQDQKPFILLYRLNELGRLSYWNANEARWFKLNSLKADFLKWCYVNNVTKKEAKQVYPNAVI
jgi:hypothetical protein